MAWQVAVVVDPNYDVAALGGLAMKMPLWAVSTQERKEAAKEIRSASEVFWAPEPALTLFCGACEHDAESTALHIIDSVELHHPRLAALQLIGVMASESLTGAMGELGYQPAAGSLFPGIRFRKPWAMIPGVKDLILDGRGWSTKDDVYDAFFQAVGAPPWHGRNLDALNDSIVNGAINQTEVPYRIIIQNCSLIGDGARDTTRKFVELIREVGAERCLVEVQLEG